MAAFRFDRQPNSAVLRFQNGPVGTFSMMRKRMRLQCGQRLKAYDFSPDLGRAPCLSNGSAKSHFKQRICQAGACFFAAMNFAAAFFAVESFALMSLLLLPFSRRAGELFLQKKLNSISAVRSSRGIGWLQCRPSQLLLKKPLAFQEGWIIFYISRLWKSVRSWH